MTYHSFGKAVPIQLDMLQLVGYEIVGRDIIPATGGNARKRAMRDGLHALRRKTGKDFGYDASAWRQFLIDSDSEEYHYTHPYAFATVDHAVQAATEDPIVIATLNELSQS